MAQKSLYGCCQSDHGAYDCPMLKTLKQNGILFYEDPVRTRLWFGSQDEVKKGLAQPLHAAMVQHYRSTIGAAKYACGVLQHSLNNGVNRSWVSKYASLCEKDSAYQGNPKVAVDKILFDHRTMDQPRRPYASSVTIYETERGRLKSSARYLYPEDKPSTPLKYPTVDQLETTIDAVKRQ
jgi:hypothetical protein